MLVFNGIEDVEYNPADSFTYVAVKGESRVYRFKDKSPLLQDSLLQFETFVGGMSYTIDYGTGTSLVPWGYGNDNLVFDDSSNLWVNQDGGDNYIWVVGKNHTQASPDVRIFGRAPWGSESTGITFTPDYKFLFMSIQHPSSSNTPFTQLDAFGQMVNFGKDVTLVMSRSNYFSLSVSDVSFALHKKENYVDVRYENKGEEGLYKVLLEQSIDLKNWNKLVDYPIQFQNGGITKTFKDYNAQNSSGVYYRYVHFYNSGRIEKGEPKYISMLKEIDFTLFPNPSQENITLSTTKKLDRSQYTIYDLLGNQVGSGNLTGKIDITLLKEGCYYLHIESSSVYLRFIKN